MAVRADLVVLVDLAVLAEFRTEHVAGVVEQRDVRRCPPHVADVLGTLPEQQQRLVFAEHAPAGRLEQGLRAEQVVEQLRRREHRPHAVERGPHLVGVAQHLAHRPRADLVVTPTRRQRRPQLRLDELPTAVVPAEPPPGRPHDPCRFLGAEPHVAGAERHHQVVAQRSLTVADRLVDHVGHPGVALQARGLGPVVTVVAQAQELHVGHEVGEHDLLDAGLAERRQHPLDVAEEHPVGADDEHALVLEREPVRVEEVRRAMQRHHGLAGAGPALHDEHAGLR